MMLQLRCLLVHYSDEKQISIEEITFKFAKLACEFVPRQCTLIHTPVPSVLVSPLAADHQAQNNYAEFEDEFDDVERQCTVLYNFEGTSQPVCAPLFSLALTFSTDRLRESS